MGREKSRLLTLIGGLRCLGDIHSQLSTEGIHSHHSCVDRGVREGRELAVVAGDTIQGLCNVSCSLQNNFLKSKRNTPSATTSQLSVKPFFSCLLYARHPARGFERLINYVNFCV